MSPSRSGYHLVKSRQAKVFFANTTFPEIIKAIPTTQDGFYYFNTLISSKLPPLSFQYPQDWLPHEYHILP